MAYSCQKDLSKPNDTKESIVNQTIEKQWIYVQENLKAIMKEMGPTLKDHSFKILIRNEVAKKFDGENNVLIKTLFANTIYSQRFNTDKMSKALGAFKNLGGENLYPQIYIPFFEKHQANRNNTSARNSSHEDGYIEFFIYDGNEGPTSVPSYIYNEEGDIIPTGTIVNEAYASNNEIYVISINETVDNDGEIPPPIVNSTSQTQSLVNFRIKDLTIKDNKESWLGGASEIHIKSNGTTWNHLLGGSTSGLLVSIPNLRYTAQTELMGYEITKIPRQEVGYLMPNINYPLHINWSVDNYFVDPIVYTYVIFEYDKWPAGLKTLASEIPSVLNPAYQFDYMNFRSSNTPYGGNPNNHSRNFANYGNVSGLTANFHYLYYDGHHLNTENIEFNTVKY